MLASTIAIYGMTQLQPLNLPLPTTEPSCDSGWAQTKPTGLGHIHASVKRERFKEGRKTHIDSLSTNYALIMCYIKGPAQYVYLISA